MPSTPPKRPPPRKRKKKTTVYLDETLLRSVKQLARSRGVSDAWVLGEALSGYVAEAGRATARRLPKSLGFADGPGDLSERTDELLAAGFGRDHADR